MTNHADHPGLLAESILKTLLYFDLFQYPLTIREIYVHLPTNHVSEKKVVEELHALVSRSLIYQLGEFFSIQRNTSLSQRRIEGNRLAVRGMSLARKQAARIARFPFVRAVMISGSLSKGYMDKNSDLDFFIITAPGRLWIARTFLVAYKRLFLLNSHKYFCVNYFIDSDHLEIEEKNRFTATELATLIPLSGLDHYENLIRINSWLLKFIPNYQRPSGQSTIDPPGKFKFAAEFLLNLSFARFLEKFCMQLTLRRWERKYQKKYDPGAFKLAFKTREYVSKNHPRNFQTKIMSEYEVRLTEFARKNGLIWQL
jgi:hypothetical protein